MRWLIGCILALTTSVAMADGPVYGELQLGGSAIEHSDLDFYPTFGSGNVGFYLFPNIGVELFVDKGLSSYEDGELELELEGAYGIALRFQSPPTGTGTQGYIVLGAVGYTLDQTSRTASTSFDEEFRGVRASLGLMQRLKRYRNLQFTAEYRHYNADEPLRVDALLLGLRVNAP